LFSLQVSERGGTVCAPLEDTMRRTLTLLATLAFAVSMATAAGAAPCKDAKGKFTKCPAPAAASYTLDAKGNCHDAKGKMAKKTMCPAAATTAAAPAAPAAGAMSSQATRTTPNCKKGKPCGKTCIAKDKECHIK
jgi:hypothetical protein